LGNGFVIARAETIATGIFNEIGVGVDWHQANSCPPDAIHIDYSADTPPAFLPASLAYARPYEGPGYFDTDLNVSKAVPILERYRLLIGASFFNILNHPNFTSPVNNVAYGFFGHITSAVPEPTAGYTGASGRVIQTMVKFIF
jgi:hypothetical protein